MIMLKKNRSGLCFIMLLALCFVPVFSKVYADGDGKGIAVSHPVDLYPGGVPVSEESTKHGNDLTKDNINEVKSFFESKKKTEDKLEPYSEDDQKGSQLVTETMGKRFQLVTMMVRTKADTYVANAFGQLKAMAMRGMHSESELQAIENSYSDLKSAYFRRVKSPDGHNRSESEIIYKKYLQTANPELSKSSSHSDDSAEYQAGKAKAADMRKQMQEMKAKGDIAGIMNMAQKNKTGPGIPKDAQKYVDEMNKDTWSTWVQCLDEMKNAAFHTSISYKSGIIGE